MTFAYTKVVSSKRINQRAVICFFNFLLFFVAPRVEIVIQRLTETDEYNMYYIVIYIRITVIFPLRPGPAVGITLRVYNGTLKADDNKPEITIGRFRAERVCNN